MHRRRRRAHVAAGLRLRRRVTALRHGRQRQRDRQVLATARLRRRRLERAATGVRRLASRTFRAHDATTRTFGLAAWRLRDRARRLHRRPAWTSTALLGLERPVARTLRLAPRTFRPHDATAGLFRPLLPATRLRLRPATTCLLRRMLPATTGLRLRATATITTPTAAAGIARRRVRVVPATRRRDDRRPAIAMIADLPVRRHAIVRCPVAGRVDVRATAVVVVRLDVHVALLRALPPAAHPHPLVTVPVPVADEPRVAVARRRGHRFVEGLGRHARDRVGARRSDGDARLRLIRRPARIAIAVAAIHRRGWCYDTRLGRQPQADDTDPTRNAT